MKKGIALLLAIAMCACLFACGKDTVSGETQAPNTNNQGGTTAEQTEGAAETTAPVTQPVTQPGLALSDNLEDFTVSIDGSVYQFPCSVQSMLDDGWQSGLGDQLYTREVEPNEDIQFAIFRGDIEDSRPVFINVYNPGKSTRTVNECIIIQITEQNDKTEVILAGDFKLSDSLTLDDIIAQYGEGSSEESNGENWYKYYFDSGYYVFVIKDGHLSWWDIIIRESAVE